MFSLRWWVILGYVACMVILLAAFEFYLRRKTGEGLFGHREIPEGSTWVFAVGIIGTWITILYPIIYLFYPNIVELTLPIFPAGSLLLDVLGTLLIITGCVITCGAMAQLGRSARVYLPGQKTRLITAGLYRFSRNPAYGGVYLSYFGIFLVLPSLLYLTGFCLFLVGQHVRIQAEERFLSKSFGADYEAYCQSVGRYLGPAKAHSARR